MFRPICVFIAAACLAVFAAGAHAAPGKPLIKADLAEAQSLYDGYAKPIMTDMDTAVTLGATDTPKACELMKKTELRAVELDTRAKALRDRLISEGKTTEGIDQMVTGAGEMVEGAHHTTHGICSGGVALIGDPAHDAMVTRMTQVVARLTKATKGYIDAAEQGDQKAYCSNLRDADAAYKELYALLLDVRSKMASGSADAQQSDAVIAKLTPLKDQLAGRLSTCPAA